jgi:hypothetical protein
MSGEESECLVLVVVVIAILVLPIGVTLATAGAFIAAAVLWSLANLIYCLFPGVAQCSNCGRASRREVYCPSCRYGTLAAARSKEN